jgi:hypothetical protein
VQLNDLLGEIATDAQSEVLRAEVRSLASLSNSNKGNGQLVFLFARIFPLVPRGQAGELFRLHIRHGGRFAAPFSTLEYCLTGFHLQIPP